MLRMNFVHFIDWSFGVRFMRNRRLLFALYPCKLELSRWFECSRRRYCIARWAVEILGATRYQRRHTVWALLCYLPQGCISWHQLVHSDWWSYLASLTMHLCEMCSTRKEWFGYLLTWSSLFGWWTMFECFSECLKVSWFICWMIDLANSSIWHCLCPFGIWKISFMFRSDLFRSLYFDLNTFWASSGYMYETVALIAANIRWLFLRIAFIIWHYMAFSFR